MSNDQPPHGQNARDGQPQDGHQQTGQSQGGHQQTGQPRQGDPQQPGQDGYQQQQQASLPLLDGEEVVINARPAWSAFFKEIVLIALLVLGGLVQGNTALIGSLVAAGLVGGYVWWKRQRLRYVVTDRRVMTLTGMGSESTNEAFMQDIRNLQSGASILERVLGHGHITVATEVRGSTVPLIGIFTSFINPSGMTLGGISNYQEIADVIRNQQNEAKRWWTKLD